MCYNFTSLTSTRRHHCLILTMQKYYGENAKLVRKTNGTSVLRSDWSDLLVSHPPRVCSGACWARTRSYRASEPWRGAGVARPTPSASTRPETARALGRAAEKVDRLMWATRSSPAPLRPSCSANWRPRVTLTPPSPEQTRRASLTSLNLQQPALLCSGVFQKSPGRPLRWSWWGSWRSRRSRGQLRKLASSKVQLRGK